MDGPVTELVTSTQIKCADSYEDFDAAWKQVDTAVREFVREHPQAQISVDDSLGFVLSIMVSER